MVRTVQGVGQGPVTVDLHDLDVGPGPRQALADERISRAPVLLGDPDDVVELSQEPAVAGRGRRAALEPERGHRHLPAVVLAAHHVGPRAARVGEEDLVEVGAAVDLLDRAHLDARLLHGHEQIGDPGVLRGVGIGPCEQEDVVGELRLRRPDLLSVDHPLVAVELGPGLERGQVAACVRLGEPLAPRDAAVENARDEPLLLLLGPPLKDGRPDQGVAEEVGAQRCLRSRELLVEHDRLDEREALPAVLLRPRRADPAPFEELLRPLAVEGPALVAGHGETRRAPPFGEVVVEPLADLDSKRLGFGWVGEVHRLRHYPWSGTRTPPASASAGGNCVMVRRWHDGRPSGRIRA